MLTSAIVAGVLTLPAAAREGITIGSPGTSLRQLVLSAAQQAAVKLDVAADIAAEPITVSLANVTLEEFKHRLADLMAAEWQPTRDGTLVLKRTPATERALFEKHLEMEQARIGVALAFLRKDVAETPWTPQEATAAFKSYEMALTVRATTNSSASYVSVDRSALRLPGGRLVARLVSALDQRVLAAQDPNTKVVFSTAPTSKQFPMGASAARAISIFEEEHATLIRAAKAIDPSKVPSGMLPLSGPYGPIDGHLATLIVVSSRMGDGSRSISFKGFDGKGDWITEGGWDLSVTPEPEVKPRRLLEDLKVSWTAPQIDFARACWTAHHSAAGGDAGSTKSIDLFLSPDLGEPLGVLGGQTLIQIALSRKQQLLAVMSDDQFNSTVAWPRAECRASTVLNGLAKSHEIDMDDSFLMIHPKDRYWCEKARLDRKAATRYLADLARTGIPSLDGEGALALAYPYAKASSFIQQYAEVVAPACFRLAPGHSSLLRFYASLTRQQLEGLSSGRAMRVAELSPRQHQLFSEYLFGTPGLLLNPAHAKAQPWITIADTTQKAGRPTEAEAIITLDVGSEEMAFGYDPVSPQCPMPFNAFGLGSQLANNGSPGQESAPGSSGYRLGKSTTYIFHVKYPGQIEATGRVVGYELDVKSRLLKYEELPASIREAAEKVAREQFGWLSKPVTKPPPPLLMSE